MTNKEIASRFKLLGNLMELHGENAFKIRSYANAYLNLRKLPEELSQMKPDQIESLPGVGKAISSKINELLETGDLKNLAQYREITPAGIIDMLNVKGLGAKKVAVIWKELEIESIGELLYAINENRLIELKGFGAKTQASIKDQLEYYVESADKQLYARIIDDAVELLEALQNQLNKYKTELTGEISRKSEIVSQIDILTTATESMTHKALESLQNDKLVNNNSWTLCGMPLIVHYTDEKLFEFGKLKSSSGPAFFEALNIPEKPYTDELDIFQSNKLPFIIPEYREDENAKLIANYPGTDNIIGLDDIKGCIHNHSTYSDGINTLEEMLQACIDRGYEYFVITDHSKSAFYANGLQEERLLQQLDEIRTLDQKYDDIRFFSGIESDILSNGDLDYPDDILAELDVVVASVHSNLKMDLDKATHRLIKAIENPYTSILGHPTGRLLLSRKAYPVDFRKVIDACAANDVAIEINANPLRLDLDWRHLDYAMSKNLMISINPDAHSTKGIDDTEFGVYTARKAALTKAHCLNAMHLDEFEEWLMDQHSKRH